MSTNTYAIKAITELLAGRTITLDGHTYCYLQKNIPIVIEGFEFDSPVGQLCLVARNYKSETESEPHLLGAEHLTLGSFLTACSAKTLEDSIMDFPVKIHQKHERIATKSTP
jgi:hypothetical protein